MAHPLIMAELHRISSMLLANQITPATYKARLLAALTAATNLDLAEVAAAICAYATSIEQ